MVRNSLCYALKTDCCGDFRHAVKGQVLSLDKARYD